MTVSNGYGGGIIVNTTGLPAPVVSNCLVTSCQAYHGGGINLQNGDGAIITHSVIENNSTYTGSGGGIYSLNTHCVIMNCIIRNNEGRDRAGGIKINDYGMIINSQIISNRGINWGHGGGVTYSKTGEDGRYMVMSNCLVKANTSPYGGAVVFRWSPLESGPHGVGTLYNCLIIDNVVGVTTGTHGSGYGAGFSIYSGTGRLVNCTIASNITTGASAIRCDHAAQSDLSSPF